VADAAIEYRACRANIRIFREREMTVVDLPPRVPISDPAFRRASVPLPASVGSCDDVNFRGAKRPGDANKRRASDTGVRYDFIGDLSSRRVLVLSSSCLLYYSFLFFICRYLRQSLLFFSLIVARSRFFF